MLASSEVVLAVSRILQRSERQEDAEKLLHTYVDVGILPQLTNDNHQVIYGRRGTGKTHVLKVLEKQLGGIPTNTIVYIDARTLGSSAQYLDQAVPIHLRCMSLFRDIVNSVQAQLLEHLVAHPSEKHELAFEALSQLGDAVMEQTRRVDRQVIIESLSNASDKSSANAEVKLAAAPSMSFRASLGSDKNVGAKTIETYKVVPEEKVYFPQIHAALSRVLDLGKTRLYILLDEWSSLPLDIQPYLSEFLKRGILPVLRVTLKIAALEHRSAFTVQREGQQAIGFEIGADIATATDLDDYLVFDRNPAQIAALYADMLYRHINSELPPAYLVDKFGVADGSRLVARMFVDQSTFTELARASEGVVRDLINIFTAAFFDAQKRSRPTIDKRAVSQAARRWFEQDKAAYLDDELREVLRRIIDQVIGQRHARSFLLPRELENHPIIQRLFDFRVLHQMQRGYADKDNPGVRYNIYTLDYGTYVDLIGTKTGPQPDMIESEELDTIVPFDDKRSIRRIVLHADVLAFEKGSTVGA